MHARSTRDDLRDRPTPPGTTGARLRRGAAGALAATLLLAAPAAADPFFVPDEAPVDSVATLELDLAHGCFANGGQSQDGGHSHGDADDEQPTLEVAVEVPDAVDHVVPDERDGWELEVEFDDDDRVSVITWIAEEDTEERAPVFELEAVHRGEVGDVVYWPVFQGCADASYRWIATPDEEEDGDPAPGVTLVEEDPDAPAPEPGDDPAADDDAEQAEEPLDEEAEDTEEPDAAEDEAELDADEAGDEGAGTGWVLLVVLLVVVVVVAAVLALRSRRVGAATGADGPAA